MRRAACVGALERVGRGCMKGEHLDRGGEWVSVCRCTEVYVRLCTACLPYSFGGPTVRMIVFLYTVCPYFPSCRAPLFSQCPLPVNPTRGSRVSGRFRPSVAAPPSLSIEKRTSSLPPSAVPQTPPSTRSQRPTSPSSWAAVESRLYVRCQANVMGPVSR